MLVIKIAWLHCKSSFLRRGGTLIIGLLSIPGLIGSSAIIVGLVGRIRASDSSTANGRARDNTTNTEEKVKFKKQCSYGKERAMGREQGLALLTIASSNNLLTFSVKPY